MIIRNAMSSLCPEILWEPQGEKKGQTYLIPIDFARVGSVVTFWFKQNFTRGSPEKHVFNCNLK